MLPSEAMRQKQMLLRLSLPCQLLGPHPRRLNDPPRSNSQGTGKGKQRQRAAATKEAAIRPSREVVIDCAKKGSIPPSNVIDPARNEKDEVIEQREERC